DLDAPRTLNALRPLVQIMPGDARTPNVFLGKFATLRKFFCSEAVIRRMAREVVADAAADHVAYLELRFTPQALSNLLQVDFRTIVAWVCDAVSEAEAEYGTLVRLIVSMNRHESVEIGERVLDAALTRRGCGVVGIDLAGREADFPAAPFAPVLERARREGLGVTVHAGEWAGAARVREAVLELHAGRIGHGVRAVEDPAVVALLREHSVTLEVCPSSNVDSGVCASLAAHQLPHLLAAGVCTTLNTDDPLISGITLTDEMARAVLSMGLTPFDLKTMTFDAARAAFLTDQERGDLLARLDADWRAIA
ncbi:MAG: adenosine deaminase, partial [Anaerolinea sp.]|nr:adenosine deaminase [Anaerolinea sp.]